MVKYDATAPSGRRHLGIHNDQSSHSFVIRCCTTHSSSLKCLLQLESFCLCLGVHSLNSVAEGDFTGGGTYFVEKHQAYNADRGQASNIAALV